MNSTEARKKLLIAECDIHRARLSSDLADLAVGAREFAHRVSAVSAVASVLAVALAGWTARRRGRLGRVLGRTDWIEKVVQAAGWVSTVWMAWRSRPEGGSGKGCGAGEERT